MSDQWSTPGPPQWGDQPSGSVGTPIWPEPSKQPERRPPWPLIVGVLGGAIVLLLAALVIVATFGGGNDKQAAPPAAFTVPSTSGRSTGSNVLDSAFMDSLHGEGIYGVTASAGHEACYKIDSGETAVRASLDFIAEYDLTAHDAGFVVGSAITAYCPEHLAQAKREIDNSGG